MLAIGAADDCTGAAGMADPLDVLEYLRCTRPYFVTCRRAADEDACLKQGKTRLPIIRKIICLCATLLSSPSMFLFFKETCQDQGASNSRAFPGHPTSCLLQSRDDDGKPLLEHSTTRNHVDYPTYPAQLAQRWPEGLTAPHVFWAYVTSANISQDFGHQMQVCPPRSRPARDDASANPGSCDLEHWYGIAKAWEHGIETETLYR